MSHGFATDLQVIADCLADLVEQQRLANLIAAQRCGVPLTGYQRDEIEAFVRNQIARIEAGV